MHATSHRKLLAGGIAGLVLVSALVATASATAPGANGSIAFRRYFDADHTSGAVFTISADGKAERQITSPPASALDDQPDWAPDGSLITFTRCSPDTRCHLFTVAPDGSGLAPVGALCGANEQACPDDAHGSFSPDSQKLAFIQASGGVRSDAYTEEWIQHSALTLMNRDGSGRRVIYQGASYSGDLDYPFFSPDGKHIVFERVASSFTLRSGQRAVFVIGTDGKQLRRLTPWEESAGDGPDWSPDGKWIAFRSHVDDDDKQSQIFIIHPDGSGRRQLTHFAAGTAQIASSTFSPDGKYLVISKGVRDGNLRVFTLRLRDGRLQRVTHSTLWDSAPDWGTR
jgi:TolB protein